MEHTELEKLEIRKLNKLAIQLLLERQALMKVLELDPNAYDNLALNDQELDRVKLRLDKLHGDSAFATEG